MLGQEYFTERVKKVLNLAQEEAHRLKHNYVGTEHILLGLLREGDGVGARVLLNMGIQLPTVRHAVECIIGRGDSVIIGEIGLTPRAKKVLNLAVDEAHKLDHKYIGTEHLLLGLIREGEGIAAGILQSFDMSLEEIRQQVLKVIKPSTKLHQPQQKSPIMTHSIQGGQDMNELIAELKKFLEDNPGLRIHAIKATITYSKDNGA